MGFIDSAIRIIMIGSSVMVIAPKSVRSQASITEPKAAEIAAALRIQGHSNGALAVLTQARRQQQQSAMHEIADSLVAIAATFPGTDIRATRTRGAALSTLLLAGQGQSGVVGITSGTPYSGAVDRLMRIAETSNDVGIRGTALWALTQVPDRTRLVPYLRNIATSQNPAAHRAIDLLNEEVGPPGRSLLLELYRGGLVTQPSAQEKLDRLAGAYGWRK